MQPGDASGWQACGTHFLVYVHLFKFHVSEPFRKFISYSGSPIVPACEKKIVIPPHMIQSDQHPASFVRAAELATSCCARHCIVHTRAHSNAAVLIDQPPGSFSNTKGY